MIALFVASCGGGVGGSASSAAGDPRITSISSEMLVAINQARSTQQTCGSTVMPAVNPVAWNDKLAQAALRHSADMASHAVLSHTGTDGSSVSIRVTQAGYSYSIIAENIAVGYPTAANVVQGWMNSPGHCTNIMTAAFSEIGAAYDTGTYLSSPNMRYWTLNLGKP